MPPVKDNEHLSADAPEAEDTLIGDWDPYLASMVESSRDVGAEAEIADPADHAAPEPGQVPLDVENAVSRRARLLADDS